MIIYKITNKINGKIYIGQTKHTVEKRWYGHYRKKNSGILKIAIDKYGKDNFTLEVLEHCSGYSEMDYLESYYIRYYDSLAPNGYNLESGGHLNRKFCSLSRQKMSDAQKIVRQRLPHPMAGKTGFLNKRSKQVLCTTNGQIYGSCRQAALSLGINRSHVSAIAGGKGRNTTKGYSFKYVDSF